MPSGGKGRGQGRKPTPLEKQKNKIVYVRATKKEHAKLEESARRAGQSMSSFVLESALAKEFAPFKKWDKSKTYVVFFKNNPDHVWDVVESSSWLGNDVWIGRIYEGGSIHSEYTEDELNEVVASRMCIFDYKKGGPK